MLWEQIHAHQIFIHSEMAEISILNLLNAEGGIQTFALKLADSALDHNATSPPVKWGMHTLATWNRCTGILNERAQWATVRYVNVWGQAKT